MIAGFGHTDCERIVGGALAQPVLAVTSFAYVVAGVAVLLWAVRVRAPLAGATAVVLVAAGAGSFAYHGPQPSWAEPAHDLPIIALGAVCVAGLVLSWRRQRLSAWAAPAGVFALALAAYAAGRSGSPLCRPDSMWQYHGAWHVFSAVAAGLAACAMAPGPYWPTTLLTARFRRPSKGRPLGMSTPKDATKVTEEQRELQEQLDHRNSDPDAPGRHQDRSKVADET